MSKLKMKTCQGCKKEKDHTEFFAVDFGGGLCKQCIREMHPAKEIPISKKSPTPKPKVEKKHKEFKLQTLLKTFVCKLCNQVTPYHQHDKILEHQKAYSLCSRCLDTLLKSVEPAPLQRPTVIHIRRCNGCRSLYDKETMVVDSNTGMEFWYCNICAEGVGL